MVNTRLFNFGMFCFYFEGTSEERQEIQGKTFTEHVPRTGFPHLLLKLSFTSAQSKKFKRTFLQYAFDV